MKSLLTFILVTTLLIAKETVAIFDYELRSNKEISTSQIVEQEIKKISSDYEVIHFNGKNSDEESKNILKKLNESNYKFIVVITSNGLRLANLYLTQKPFIFTNVNNPYFLGYKSRKLINSTGVTYYIPAEVQFNYFLNIYPSIKKIGFIFDNSNLSRFLELREFREYLSKNKLIGEFEFLENDNLKKATENLLKKNVDAIVLTSSDKIYNNAESIISIAYKANKPVFSINSNGVMKGALASVGTTYDYLNQSILPKVLKSIMVENNEPRNIEAIFSDKYYLYVNKNALETLKLKLPNNLNIEVIYY